jgi:hypothetical protein
VQKWPTLGVLDAMPPVTSVPDPLVGRKEAITFFPYKSKA